MTIDQVHSIAPALLETAIEQQEVAQMKRVLVGADLVGFIPRRTQIKCARVGPHRPSWREADNNMARSLIVLAVVCAVLFGMQTVLANRRGTESDIKAQLASVVPPTWHFVALEYCYGMLNRTYVAFVTDAMICGARVRGLLPADGRALVERLRACISDANARYFRLKARSEETLS